IEVAQRRNGLIGRLRTEVAMHSEHIVAHVAFGRSTRSTRQMLEKALHAAQVGLNRVGPESARLEITPKPNQCLFANHGGHLLWSGSVQRDSSTALAQLNVA